MNWNWHTLGDPSHSPVVFLHGFMGKGEDWMEIAEGLSDRFYCLIPDLPGHGATPLDKEPSYTAWTSALRDELSALKVTHTRLVGYSMGGRIALIFALTYPKMVTRLVLESANPGIINAKEREQRASLDDKLAEDLRQNGMKDFLTFWYNIPLFASLDHLPSLKEKLCKQRINQDPDKMATVLSALSPGQQPELWSRLKELELPTLLIAGELDSKYLTITKHVAAILFNQKRFTVSNCGHNTHRESPSTILSLLANWL